MLHRKTRSLAVLTSLVLAGACASLVGPPGIVPVEFAFGVNRLANEAAFLVERGAEAVVVRGSLRTPCQPYDARASADVVDGTLVLRVTGVASGGCPQDVVSSVGYQAIVRTRSADYTRLRVVHRWKDANWPEEIAVDTAWAVR